MAVNLVVENAKPIANTWKLSFDQVSDGVNVIVTSDNGEEWSLLKLKDDGSLHLYEFIGNDSGFELTKYGKLVESKTP